MLSTLLIFEGKIFNHRISLDDQGSVIENKVYPPPPEQDQLYEFLSENLDIKEFEMTVVLRAQATENDKIFLRIISCYKLIESTYKIKVKKTRFFIEDLIKFDAKNRIKDFKLIEKIMESVPHEYEIFHCEQMNNIKYFDWFSAEQIFHLFSKKQKPITSDFNQKICCLNNRFDERRYIISSWLASKNDAIDFSQHYALPMEEIENFSLIPEKYKSSIISGAKILRGDKTPEDHRTSSFEGTKVLTDTTKLPTTAMPIWPPLDWISDSAVDQLIDRTKNAFCSVITESRYETPWPNFSEKTLRVITSGRPFILAAPAGTLGLLRDLGIKTFGDFWDESYDLVDDPKQRLSMILDQVDLILRRTDHKEQLSKMMPILEHNQQAMKSMPKKMLTIS